MMNWTDQPSPEHTLADYVALEYILLGDLRDLLEEAESDEQTTRWVVAVLDALLEMLPHEIELKSEGGYLQEVLEQYPNWAGLVGELASEKQALFEKLGELRFQLHCPHSIEVQVLETELRCDLREWMTLWTAHLRHERRMMQSAFTLDVGCGD